MKQLTSMLIVVVVLSTCALSACGDSTDQNQSAPQQSAEANTPKPLSPAEQKKRFLKTVDESISGARIASNRYKFVGKHVDLHCTVVDIPQADFFNAECGQDENGDPVVIVIEADSRTLEKDQAVRIMGIVAEPMEGNNAMGGQGSFPTVRALFME